MLHGEDIVFLAVCLGRKLKGANGCSILGPSPRGSGKGYEHILTIVEYSIVALISIGTLLR